MSLAFVTTAFSEDSIAPVVNADGPDAGASITGPSIASAAPAANPAIPTLAANGASDSTPSDTEQDAVSIDSNLKLVPKSEHEENAQLHYTIDVIYPQIQGQDISANAQRFNKIVDDIAHQEVSQFKKYVTADAAHMQTLPEEVRKNTFNMDYAIDVVQPNNKSIISVRLAIEGFQAGRAHPYHTYRVVNFDLATGKELTLSELFKSHSNFLNVIAKYCQQTLSKTLEDKWMIAEGTKPLAKNFKNWNLQSDSILITFDEYQVAPYVNGAQEVEIPYSVLKNIISSQGSIYPCIKQARGCAGAKVKAKAVK